MPTRIGRKRPPRIFVVEWREARGLTQEQLAGRLGVSSMTVSRWERGAVDMNTGVLSALADAFDIDMVDLFHHPDQPSADALLKDQTPDIREQAIRVIQALRKAN